MSEIIKLYDNANIEPKRCSECENNNMDCGFGKGCYTPFTAEKQIELIKLLSKRCMTIDCEDGEYEVYTGFDDNIIENFYDKLEDAIAYCVNRIWQDLTNEEKQQIKEILK